MTDHLYTAKYGEEKLKIVDDWINQVDMAGPFMDQKKLEEFYFNAPDEVKSSETYYYVCGLYDGRAYFLEDSFSLKIAEKKG